MSRDAQLLDQAREATARAERQRALRAVLRHPLLTPDGPGGAAFPLVRRHAAHLRAWLAEQAGWRLDVGVSVARLRKVPADHRDATRPARTTATGRGNRPFSRRQYVLLCLALAALERGERQTTLSRLADEILGDATDPALVAAGIVFALDTADQRRDLVAVVRVLIELRVLARVHGDEQAYVAATGDALYDVDRRVLAAMLATRRGPSTVDGATVDERIAAATAELVADTEDARTRAVRHTLTRRRLDDPVVYLDELSEAEHDYLAKQRTTLLRRLEDATGLVGEVRAEGLALVDPTGDATDLGMPQDGTDGHATLLLAEHLIGRDRPVPVAELERHAADLAQRYRTYWRGDTRQPGGEVALVAGAVERLEALRLVRRTPDGVLGLPALARYAVAPPTAGTAGLA